MRVTRYLPRAASPACAPTGTTASAAKSASSADFAMILIQLSHGDLKATMDEAARSVFGPSMKTYESEAAPLGSAANRYGLFDDFVGERDDVLRYPQADRV